MNRRELFALAGAVLLACGEKPPPLPLAPRAHLDAARAVGRAWLDDGGQPRDVQALSADLLAGFPGGDAAAFTAHLLARHRDDLAAERTTRAGGWLLSRTEAHLYAWLSLT